MNRAFPLRYSLPLLLLVLGGSLAFLLIGAGIYQDNLRVETEARAELEAVGRGAVERLDQASSAGTQNHDQWQAAVMNFQPHLAECAVYDEADHLLGRFAPHGSHAGASGLPQSPDLALLNAARTNQRAEIRLSPGRTSLRGAFPFHLSATNAIGSVAPLGVMYATMDLRSQKDSEFVANFQSAAVICTLTLLLMWLSWAYLNRTLTRRVASLIAVSREFANGNLGCRASLTPGDEFAELAVAFNQMAVQMQERNNALSESEERYRRIVETAYEGIFVLDAEHCLTFVNRRFAQMLGSTIDAMTGCGWRELLFEEDWEDYHNRVVRRQFSDASRHERRLRRKDGGEVWAILSFAVLRDASGVFAGAFVMAADITERKHVESQLQQAQKMEAFSQLAGGIAHEFNNLLTVIVGYSSLLRFSAVLGNEDLAMANEIYDAGNRAGNLTRQLQLFSRQQPLQQQPTDLNSLLRDCSTSLRGILGQQIRLQLPECAVPEIAADGAAIKQALEHLAANARESMPRGGRLSLESRLVELAQQDCERHPEALPGRFVCLSVSDSGTGMDKTELEHIFEPFYTAGHAGRSKGFGLATVYSIVKQHKGWTEVESEAGRGTTFELFLPLSETSLGTAKATIPTQPLENNARKKTILLVEDDPGVRNIAKACLRRSGYHVLEAVNGTVARNVWGHHSASIDLLFTDVVLPGEWNGNDLACEFRRQRPELKVLFSSGYNRERTTQIADQVTSGNYLTKPFDPELLVATIRQMLAN